MKKKKPAAQRKGSRRYLYLDTLGARLGDHYAAQAARRQMARLLNEPQPPEATPPDLDAEAQGGR